MLKTSSRNLMPTGRVPEVPNLIQTRIPNGEAVDQNKAMKGYHTLGHVSRPLSIPKFELT